MPQLDIRERMRVAHREKCHKITTPTSQVAEVRAAKALLATLNDTDAAAVAEQLKTLRQHYRPALFEFQENHHDEQSNETLRIVGKGFERLLF